MINLFGKSENQSRWLAGDNDLREKLYTLILSKVKNPFEPAGLWDQKYGGGKEIVVKGSERDTRRLRDALDRHRGTVVLPDGGRKWIEAEKVFNHVIVHVPMWAWEQELQMSTGKLERLAKNLAEFHHEDFGKHLISPERHPGYMVIPSRELQPDEVAFQFGFGVFVPGEDDRLVGKISLKIQDKTPWIPLSDMVRHENGKSVKKARALYADQQFLLIGPTMETGAIAPPADDADTPVWFSHGRGYIWLNMANETSDFAFGDNQFVGKAKSVPKNLAESKTHVYFEDIHPDAGSSGPPEVLMLKIDPVSETGQTHVPENRHGELEQRAERDSYTIIPGMGALDDRSYGRTIIPGMMGRHLLLVGFALLKACDFRDSTGLSNWKLWFDNDGRPMSGNFKDVSDTPAFASLSDKDTLWCRNPGEKQFKKITAYPFSVTDRDGKKYEVISPGLPDAYHGVLMLPEPAFYPLERKKYRMGYGVSENDLKIDLLCHPQSLEWLPGKGYPGSTLGHLNFSGNHAELMLKEERLEVKMTTGKVKIYHLDAQMKPIESRTGWPSPDMREMTLSVGEHLLIGGYLFCFR